MMATLASCWLRSSCSSRAIRARSSSWALINRPDKSWFCSAAVAEPLLAVAQRELRTAASDALHHESGDQRICAPIISTPPMMYGSRTAPRGRVP